MSKGEWGKHNYYENTPQYFKETPEDAVKLPIHGFLEWLFHSPHVYGNPESVRHRYPSRLPEELSEAYCALSDLFEDSDISEKAEITEKLYAIVGCLIRSPVVGFEVKCDIFNHEAAKAKRENYFEEYSEMVSD